MKAQVETTEDSLLPIVKTVTHTALDLAPAGQAPVVALSGDLGAGKTTFVQTLAQFLGVGEPVTSPTFVLQKTYPVEHERLQALVHMDAYRLEDASDLSALGFSDLLEQPDHLVCVEWGERVAAALPTHTLWLALAVSADGVHTIASEQCSLV